MKKINKSKILAILENIFREVFDDEKLRITERTKATDIEEWDSLNQIKLIISCEKEFSVQLKPREINNLQNVGQMLDHLTEKLSTKNS
jgi:acyl carrier protein